MSGLLSLLGFATCDVNIDLKNVEGRKKIEQQNEKDVQSLYIYTGEEAVAGSVSLKVKPGKKWNILL